MNQLPEGVTEQLFVKIVTKIISKVSKKLIFPTHDFEDIQQQGWVLAVEGVRKFDPTKIDKPLEQALENFLRVHITNRLKTYRRDNVGSSEPPTNPARILAWQKRMQERKNLAYPVDIDTLVQHITYEQDMTEMVNYREVIASIQKRLPLPLRNDFLRMVEGVKISKTRQQKVREAVAEIIDWSDDGN